VAVEIVCRAVEVPASKAMYEKLGYTVYRIENIVEDNEVYVNYYFEKDLL
jgi:hypothetical protein